MTSTGPRFGIRFFAPRFWGVWIAVILLFLLSLLPLFVLDKLAELLASPLMSMRKRRVIFVQQNLRTCFPEKPEAEIDRLTREQFVALIRNLLHYPRLHWMPRSMVDRFIMKDGFEHIEKALREGDNIIILTLHSIAIDFACVALSLRFPVAAMYKPMKNEFADWIIARARTRFGAEVIARDEGMRPLIRHAKDGKLIIYLADEDLGADKTEFAPFFAAEKATIPALGRLLKLSGSVAVPTNAYYVRNKRRYVTVCLPALEEYPSGDQAEDLRRMNQAIETMILQSVEQYLWTMRYFKTRPEGEDPIYPARGEE